MASQYEVVHDKVAIRKTASTKAAMLSVATKGQTLSGVATVVEGNAWVRIDNKTKEFHRIQEKEDAYVLIHGASVGLGELLRKVQVQEKPPAPAPQETPFSQTKKLLSMVEKKKEELAPAKQEEDHEEMVGRSHEFVVVHSKVVVRQQASTTAAMVAIIMQGTLLEGVVVEVDGIPWLKQPKGYILIDGKSVGLGVLLEPAADIAEDIVRWAEQHQTSAKGKQAVPISEVEDELRLHEREVRAQVDTVKGGLDDVVVLKVLEQHALISEADFSLGAEELGKVLRRYVLRARAGCILFGEEGPTTSSLWKERQFADFLNERIVPLLPFHYRTFSADDTQRVLVAFHGSYVRGDDLADDAHVFRTMSPETTVVLPEAPTIVEKENELRVWWQIDKQAIEAVDGNSEEAAKLAFEAPKDIISRAVATLRSVRSRFGTSMPIILAGFSQGAMLAVQMLHSLGEASMLPMGLALLSGLLQPFSIPPHLQNCVAIHGEQDDKIAIQLARKVAQEMQKSPLVFIEFPGLGHEISQKVLDKLLDFCNTAAPLENRSAKVDTQTRLSEIRQAKVINWVKGFSSKAKTFNNDFFMGHIMVMNMVGLGPECPSLGGASNIRYFLHDAGPESRGLVLLFHGKIANLRKDTDDLAQAYMKAFKMSVAIIDYRQMFSSFLVDAQIALEAVEEISRSISKPIIIHSIGIGCIHGLHCAMASMALPEAVQRRFRLLVLDAPVSVFKALPPSPTGCIATDPIGNNQKLQYVGMPIILLSGEDACSGIQVQPKHFAIMSGAIEELYGEGQTRREDIKVSDNVALADRGKDARLCADLYYAVSRALESAHRAPNSQKCDLLMTAVSELESVSLEIDEAKSFAAKLLDTLSKKENLERLWLIRSMDLEQRGQRQEEFFMDVCDPLLRDREGFSSEGFRKFERILAGMVDESKELEAAHRKLRPLIDLGELDNLVEESQKNKAATCGVALASLHATLDKSLKDWNSFQVREELLAKMKNDKGAKLHDLIQQKSKQLNDQAIIDLGVKNEAEMNQVFLYWSPIDLSLGFKTGQIQKAAVYLQSTISSELGSANSKAKALAEPPQKKAANTVADFTPPARVAPPYKPKGDPEMDVVVYIDKELDLKYELRVKKGTTIATLKMRLAEEDPTGLSDALQLCLRAEGQQLPANDGALITEHLGTLEICDPPGKALPSCTRTVALQCQKEIIETCASSEFQRKLAEALALGKGDSASAEFQVARAELMLEAQKTPASKHGFGDKPIHIRHMVGAIAQFNCDLEVHENAVIIQNLIER